MGGHGVGGVAGQSVLEDVETLRPFVVGVGQDEAGRWRADLGTGIELVYVPPGPFTMGVAPGEGVGHYEAPRGEVFHYIRSDGSNRPVRHKVRAPSYMNVPTNQEAVIGETISHYEVLEKLGSGGMGVVYKANDPRFEREVAIKVLPGELLEMPEFQNRFTREAKVVALATRRELFRLSLSPASIADMFTRPVEGDTRGALCTAHAQHTSRSPSEREPN